MEMIPGEIYYSAKWGRPLRYSRKWGIYYLFFEIEEKSDSFMCALGLREDLLEKANLILWRLVDDSI